MTGYTKNENEDQIFPKQQTQELSHASTQDQTQTQIEQVFNVHQTDIPEDILPRISQIIKSAFGTKSCTNSIKLVTGHIKKSCDLEFGKYWHCIIGKSFGSNVSHGKI